jgi:hypothetical protein
MEQDPDPCFSGVGSGSGPRFFSEVGYGSASKLSGSATLLKNKFMNLKDKQQGFFRGVWILHTPKRLRYGQGWLRPGSGSD